MFNQKTAHFIKKGRCVISKAVSRGQALQIAARVATQVLWDELDGDQLQEEVINLSPKEFGQKFTQFLKNGANVKVSLVSLSGDLKIATAPFDPVGFIGGEGWKIISEEEDERSAKLTEVDFSKAKFVCCLEKGESSIKGEEKLRRLKKSNNIRLGASVFMALWKDYQIKKENSVLERLYQTGPIKGYLDFFGTILLDPDGYRHALSLYRHGAGEWCWRVYWLEHDWVVRGPSVVLPQV